MSVIEYILPFITNLLRYFIFAGLPFLIFYVFFPNTYAKSKIQLYSAKKNDFVREILHSVQTTLILVTVALLIIKSPLKTYTQFHNTISDYSLWWIPLGIIISLLLQDTYFYWVHRTLHHPKLYHRIHLTHHKSTNPSPWASYSFHVFEAIIESLFVIVLLVLIPMSKISLILFTFCAFSINVYGHLGYEIAPKWFRTSFLFEILNSSVHHNMHHSKFKGNYGLYFRIWDRIMKTENPDYVKTYDEIQKRRFP
ncbi:sterol desaturase family protein [Wenyingzhuangia aestuarii]|uniref:sterol desaturase family protein n=1 Tax=Wenyingzhuangia aestuarii TaxID=1647582 RepID=UPI00143B02B5|nr:sterol desaturase family protein [Wenyingzhuangia aestuarii]NJB84089.1 sterol desaturase/sphingolipid hydroxylase (fatty acid hydroxylase superfamily) [Wenyingzhuangia aestuarii]